MVLKAVSKASWHQPFPAALEFSKLSATRNALGSGVSYEEYREAAMKDLGWKTITATGLGLNNKKLQQELLLLGLGTAPWVEGTWQCKLGKGTISVTRSDTTTLLSVTGTVGEGGCAFGSEALMTSVFQPTAPQAYSSRLSPFQSGIGLMKFIENGAGVPYPSIRLFQFQHAVESQGPHNNDKALLVSPASLSLLQDAAIAGSGYLAFEPNLQVLQVCEALLVAAV